MNAAKTYPALIIVLVAVGGVTMLGMPQLSRFFGPSPRSSEGSSVPEATLTELPASDYVVPDQPMRSASTSQSAAARPIPGNQARGQGGTLRVGNQTDHPIRVVLMPRSAGAASSAKATASSEPIHWDFAPGEGGLQGLKLSIPESDLKVTAGDVIVAFATDGTRRYWGPNVVGETSAPFWNTQTQEWSMILQP